MIDMPDREGWPEGRLLHIRRSVHHYYPRANPIWGEVEADVEKTVVQGNLFSGGYRDTYVPVSHKCLLTARLVPERSTVLVER